MKRIAAAAVAAACIALVPSLGFAADPPDATLDLRGVTAGLGLGVEWAKGTLHYQGRSILVSIKGLDLASVEAGTFTASGEVHHLHHLADFTGRYAAVSAGAALAGGGAVAAMRNDKGVVIRMQSMTQGVELELGANGLFLKAHE